MSAGRGWALVVMGFVAILVYDGALLGAGRKSMTRWMREMAEDHPLIPLYAGFLVGLLLGHLYL